MTWTEPITLEFISRQLDECLQHIDSIRGILRDLRFYGAAETKPVAVALTIEEIDRLLGFLVRLAPQGDDPDYYALVDKILTVKKRYQQS